MTSWFAELLDWRMAFVFWVVTIAIGTVTYVFPIARLLDSLTE